MSLIGAKSMIIKELLETKEFIYLKNAKLEVIKNMDNKSEIIEFQKKQDIFNLKRYKNEDTAGLLEELESEYRRLSSVEVINNFFQAERAMNELISSIFDEVRNTLDFNLS